MKMRYTHLGACREGQGMVTLDKNSEQCKKIRQQLAQMDPAKQCARQKANREECEQRIGETRKQLAAMCVKGDTPARPDLEAARRTK